MSNEILPHLLDKHEVEYHFILHSKSINKGYIRVIVFTATFNNISVISWRSVLLVNTLRKPQTCHKSLSTLRHERDSNSR
jgi:hypothetical protein